MLHQKDKMIELEMLIFRNCEYLLYKADAYSKWTCMSSTTKSWDLRQYRFSRNVSQNKSELANIVSKEN